jgi:hypothetical protein
VSEELRVAWLAGLLDGEGSIGCSIQHRPERSGRAWRIGVAVQMSITHVETIDAALAVLAMIGVKGAGYSYQERDPERHLDAHYLRVTRLVDISLLARRILPHAITKRHQWALILEFTESRLLGAYIDEHGRVQRGGLPSRPFNTREVEIAQELRRLNARGPGAKRKDAAWHARLDHAAQ